MVVLGSSCCIADEALDLEMDLKVQGSNLLLGMGRFKL